MEIILRQDFPSLGKAGDKVRVKDGYARNYLIPRNIAMIPTTGSLRAVEMERKAREMRLARQREAAQALKEFLGHVQLTVRRRAGEEGKLFGSVTNNDVYAALVGRVDVARFLEEKGQSIDKRLVLLDEPIKEIGTFDIQVKLHTDVFATVKVHVEAEA